MVDQTCRPSPETPPLAHIIRVGPCPDTTLWLMEVDPMGQLAAFAVNNDSPVVSVSNYLSIGQQSGKRSLVVAPSPLPDRHTRRTHEKAQNATLSRIEDVKLIAPHSSFTALSSGVRIKVFEKCCLLRLGQTGKG
jgi:hypothetical protein